MNRIAFVRFIMATVAMGALIVGCATTAPEKVLPDWIGMPIQSGGFASTECVVSSNNISIDRKEALSKAQITLAQQLSAKVEAMDQTYQNIVRKGGQVVDTEDVFQSKGRLIINTTVKGARLQRQDYATINQRSHFCVQVTIADESRNSLFQQVVKAAEVDLSARNEENLYAAFLQSQ